MLETDELLPPPPKKVSPEIGGEDLLPPPPKKKAEEFQPSTPTSTAPVVTTTTVSAEPAKPSQTSGVTVEQPKDLYPTIQSLRNKQMDAQSLLNDAVQNGDNAGAEKAQKEYLRLKGEADALAAQYAKDHPQGAKKMGLLDTFLHSASTTIDDMVFGFKYMHANDEQKAAMLKESMAKQQAETAEPKGFDMGQAISGLLTGNPAEMIESVSGPVASTLGGLSPYIAAGMATGGAGALPALITGSATFGLAGGGAAAKAGYMKAKQQGMSDEEAMKVAHTDAMAATGIDVMTGGLLHGMGGGEVPKTGMEWLAKTAKKNTAIGSIFAATQAAKNSLDKAQGLDVPVMEGVPQAFATGATIGIIMDGLHKFGSEMSAPEKAKLQDMVAYTNPQAAIEGVSKAVEQGVLTPADGASLTMPIAQKAETFKQMPDVPFDKAVEVAPHVEEITKLQEQLKTASPAFHETIKGKIDAETKVLHEKLGTPLTDAEWARLDELNAKANETDANGKKKGLDVAEKAEKKHLEARDEQATKNIEEAKKAAEIEAKEAETAAQEKVEPAEGEQEQPPIQPTADESVTGSAGANEPPAVAPAEGEQPATEPVAEPATKGAEMPKEISDLYNEAATLRFTLNALEMQMRGQKLTGKSLTEYNNTKSRLENIELKLREYENSPKESVKTKTAEPPKTQNQIFQDGQYAEFYDDLYDETHKVKVLYKTGDGADGTERYQIQFEDGKEASIWSDKLKHPAEPVEKVEAVVEKPVEAETPSETVADPTEEPITQPLNTETDATNQKPLEGGVQEQPQSGKTKGAGKMISGADADIIQNSENSPPISIGDAKKIMEHEHPAMRRVLSKIIDKYEEQNSTENATPKTTNKTSISSQPQSGNQGGETESTSVGDSLRGEAAGGKEGEKVKKTITTRRAYEGEFRDEVKSELEKIGLTREVENQEVAKERALQFIDSVGEDAALDAVRSGDVTGASAAFVWNELIERVDKQLADAKTPEEVRALAGKQAELIDEFGKQALEGGRFSAALAKIYEQSDLGYNLQKKIKDYKEANNGEIPKDVEDKFRELDEQLKEVKSKLKEAEDRIKKEEEKKAVENIRRSVLREKGKRETPIVFGKQRIAKGLDDLASALGAKMSAYGDERSKVVDALSEIGRGLIEVGGATIENVVGKVKEYVAEKFGGKINVDDFAADIVTSIEAMQKEGETSGRVKIKKSLIRELVEGGIDNIDDLTKAVAEKIKDQYPDATEREIRDAITGYGKTVNLSKDEVDVQIRKMKNIGRIVSALEDVANKKRPVKSGAQRDKMDAQERALRKQLREAMKDLPMDEATIESQLKTELDRRKAYVKNRIEDLQREIERGEQTPKNARTVREDAELKALKDEMDRVKKEHDTLFKDDDYKERRKTELAKKAAQRRIEDLQRKLKEGDFEKKVVKPAIEDTELTKLRAEKLRLQSEYDKEFYKAKLANRTRAERVRDSIWDAWGLTRGLSATGEASFVGVQGLIQTIAHPKYAIEGLKNAYKMFKSEKETERFLNNIKAQEWYPLLKQSKLAITEPHAEVTAREELFYSGWTDMMWNMLGTPFKAQGKEAYEKWKAANPAKAIERASVGYLDTMRILRFMDGMEMLKEKGISPSDNPQAYKDMADVINTLTGRASLGKAEMIAEPLSKIFFSPRNWASQIKTATPYGLYHFGKMRAAAEGFKPSVAQKMALNDFSKAVGLTTGMVMLAAASLNNDDDPETGVEFDPRSSDFMKIKLGDKRIDPWGGRIQQIVALSRLMADSIKMSSGEVAQLGIEHKTPTKQDLLLKMAINKLAPSAAISERYLSSKVDRYGNRVDEYGNPYELSEDVKKSLYPIYYGTLYDLYKDDPSSLNGLLAFYAFFGGGVNVYNDDEMLRRIMEQRKNPPKPKSLEERQMERDMKLKKEEKLKKRARERGFEYVRPR